VLAAVTTRLPRFQKNGNSSPFLHHGFGIYSLGKRHTISCCARCWFALFGFFSSLDFLLDCNQIQGHPILVDDSISILLVVVVASGGGYGGAIGTLEIAVEQHTLSCHLSVDRLAD
jgi:hypothetical protein